MSEMVDQIPALAPGQRVGANLQRRYAADRRFRACGVAAIVTALAFLVLLLGSIVAQGWTAFVQSEIRLTIQFDPAVIDPDGHKDPAALKTADYAALISRSLAARFPDAAGRAERRELSHLMSPGADLELRTMLLADPALLGETREVWLPASAALDQLVKGHTERSVEAGGQFTDRELQRIDSLKGEGRLATRFNKWLFTQGDSREPELAGLWGAVVGSAFSLMITLALSFPLGVAAAVYLEEFAGAGRWTDIIEVNINNLAAVPSIVFGLLALEIFLNLLGLPRSAPLAGGLALTLVSLPTIIIAARVALKAVPPWVREAALALGASRQQMVVHHVLPLAMPGILTGTIIGMARAVGETAPLLMIGMVAFVVNIPATPLDPATALPVQIYLWAASPERAFVERTSAAIIVLLGFLALLNAGAIILRKRYERRWG